MQVISVSILKTTEAKRTSYTPKNGEMMWEYENKLLYIGDDVTPGGNLYSGGGSSGGDSIYPKMRWKGVEDDYTLSFSDEVILADTNAHNVIITLPNAMTYPDDSTLKTFYIHNYGMQRAIVQLSGNNTFPSGHNKIVIPPGEHSHIACKYWHDGVLGWTNVNRTRSILQARNDNTISNNDFDSDFYSIPFTITDIECNDALIDHESDSNNTKIYTGATTIYSINYKITINSTGGNAWVAETRILKNGSEAIPGGGDRIGNYGQEDGSLDAQMNVILMKGDYIEIQIKNSCLYGHIERAIVSVVVET